MSTCHFCTSRIICDHARVIPNSLGIKRKASTLTTAKQDKERRGCKDIYTCIRFFCRTGGRGSNYFSILFCFIPCKEHESTCRTTVRGQSKQSERTTSCSNINMGSPKAQAIKCIYIMPSLPTQSQRWNGLLKL